MQDSDNHMDQFFHSQRRFVSMSVFSKIGCLINRHDPLRRDVTWDGLAYVGVCRHCGAPIKRHRRNNWQKSKESSPAKG